MAAPNPALKGLRGTVNNVLAARGIRHSTYLKAYENQEVQKAIGLLNDNVIPDLVAEYQKRLSNIATRGFDTSTATTTRLKNMIRATDGLTRGLVSQVADTIEGDMKKLALSESHWQVAAITDAVPVKVDLLTPSPRLLESIVTERPFDGHLMKDWFSRLTDDIQFKVQQQIQIGLTRGDSVPQMVNRIAGTKTEKGVMDTTRRNAEAIVRTATNHVTTQSKEVTYEENDDVVDQVQMVATLDARTTEICMDQDGKVYPINEGPRPPFHYNCRTITVPVIKSWKDLGIDLEEAPPSTRASMDGQVSDKLTYGDWLKGQPDSVIAEALGPARAELFKSGKAKVGDFTNDKGKLLTLEQLKAKGI